MTSTNSLKAIKIDDLMLLHGKPILIPETSINVYPIKLKEISQIGSDKFFFLLGLLCMNPTLVDKEFLKDSNFEENEKILLYFITFAKQDIKFQLDFCQAISFFTKEKVSFNTEEAYFFVEQEGAKEEQIITVSVLEALQYIVSRQNFLSVDKKEEFKPANDKAAEIIAKRKSGRAKVNELKTKNLEGPNFSDLVSSLAAKGNGLNIFNIWNLNYYAFNDQLKRMGMIEEYDVGIQSLMAGADSKKVKLKYWIRNIQSE